MSTLQNRTTLCISVPRRRELMDARLPLTAAAVSVLVLTSFWISSAPRALPDDVGHATRADRVSRQGVFGGGRINPVAAAMALLHPQTSDGYQWADAPGQGRPLRPKLPTPWYFVYRE